MKKFLKSILYNLLGILGNIYNVIIFPFWHIILYMNLKRLDEENLEILQYHVSEIIRITKEESKEYNAPLLYNSLAILMTKLILNKIHKKLEIENLNKDEKED